jgi:hypothetical protein
VPTFVDSGGGELELWWNTPDGLYWVEDTDLSGEGLLRCRVATPRGLSFVELDGGTPFNEYTEVTAPLGDTGTVVNLVVEVVDAQPCVTSLTVTRTEAPFGITATLVSDAPIAKLLDFTIGLLAEHAVGTIAAREQPGYTGAVSLPAATGDAYRGARRSATASLRGRPVSGDVLARVAEIVRDNPHDPRRHIIGEFYVSPRTASRWIAKARDRGLLGAEE